jgi:hypothetical protein
VARKDDEWIGTNTVCLPRHARVAVASSSHGGCDAESTRNRRGLDAPKPLSPEPRGDAERARERAQRQHV